jgi:hypothetical protein
VGFTCTDSVEEERWRQFIADAEGFTVGWGEQWRVGCLTMIPAGL